MKRHLLFYAIVSVVFAFTISACEKEHEDIAVASVSITPSTLEITEGEIYSLSANVLPANATNKTVIWSTSDNKIVTVDQSGNIVALQEGRAAITATANGKGGSCAVTVKKKIIRVTGINLNQTNLTLEEGQTEQLRCIITPTDATNQNVSWKSSDTKIATVEEGKITAVKAGTATISVITDDGSKTATCALTVTSKPIEVTSVSLNKKDISLLVGNSYTLTASVSPSDATNKQVKWTSDDATIANVDSNGKVNAIKVGSTTITVITEDGGKKATCNVTVNPIPVESVSLNKSSIELSVGEQESLVAKVLPENAGDKKIYWKSSNTEVATVDSDGKVTAVHYGKATITVTSNNGDKSAYCYVIVHGKVIMTTESNSPIMQLMYSSGLAANKDKMYLEEAASVTNEQINIFSKITDVSVGSYSVRDNVGRNFSFNEFKYFTNVTEIPAHCFQGPGSRLLSITLPESIKIIRQDAFLGCSSLKELYLPNSIGIIESAAFAACSSLSSITLPKSLKSIEFGILQNCTSLRSIYIQDGVTVIGPAAFNNCTNLTSISIPNSVQECNYSTDNFIGQSFQGCTSLSYAYNDKIFAYLNPDFVGEFELPNKNTVETISAVAFDRCSKLTSVVIPDNVSKVERFAFQECRALKTLTIGRGVKDLCYGAFNYCTSLSTIKCLPLNAPTLGNGVFGFVSGGYTGRDSFNKGINKLYISSSAKGYDTGDWLNMLCNSSICGFSVVKQ